MSPTSDTDTPAYYHAHLLTSLNAINTYNPPVHTCSTGWFFNGLISGPTSIAYLFYRLIRIYPETFEFKGQGLREWAESYIGLGGRMACGVNVNLSRGWKGEKGGREMQIGCDEMTTWMVVRGIIEEDEGCVAEVVRSGQRGLDQVMRHENGNLNGSDHVAGGLNLEDPGWWAGYLYLLRVLKTAFPSVRSTKMIRGISEQVVNSILTCEELRDGAVSAESLELMVGVLTQIVLSREHDHVKGLENLLVKFIDLQDQKSGNWGVSTAFIVNSLESVYSYLPQQVELRQHIATAIEKARSFLSQLDSGQVPPTMQPDGLVTKALAFTGPDGEWFHDVLSGLTNEHLDQTRPGWKEYAGIKDEWVGLMTGEAGRAWVWAVAELSSSGKMERRILGYNDV